METCKKFHNFAEVEKDSVYIKLRAYHSTFAVLAKGHLLIIRNPNISTLQMAVVQRKLYNILFHHVQCQ